MRAPGFNDWRDEQIVAQYRTGRLGAREIAAQFNVSPATVDRILVKHGAKAMDSKTARTSPTGNMHRVQPAARLPDPDSLPRVDRDPCFFCGARADLGCKHRRAR